MFAVQYNALLDTLNKKGPRIISWAFFIGSLIYELTMITFRLFYCNRNN
jgi:hypothetical protein